MGFSDIIFFTCWKGIGIETDASTRSLYAYIWKDRGNYSGKIRRDGTII